MALARLRALFARMRAAFAALVAFLAGLVRGHPCEIAGCRCEFYDDSETFRALNAQARDPAYARRVLDSGVVGKLLKCDPCGHPREAHGSLAKRRIDPECMPNGGAVLYEQEKRLAAARRASRFGSDITVAPAAPLEASTEDMEVGDGAEAAIGWEVLCSYVASFASDGTQFETGDDFRFTIGAGAVIRGLDEGVRGMRVGGKRKIIVPPELAYGGRKDIDGRKGEKLVFTVALLASVPV